MAKIFIILSDVDQCFEYPVHDYVIWAPFTNMD